MNIYCVVRNYAPHAAEMQSAQPAEPTFFEKPDTALLPTPATYTHPPFTQDLQHELELVIRIERQGSRIPLPMAHQFYHSVALGIDFTARDLQRKAKADGLPWLLSKGFDHSAVVSTFLPLQELGKPIGDLTFSLLRNNQLVQQGPSREMIFPPDRLIARLSQFITLNIGDLIYTGTPAGVGTVRRGDHLVGILESRPLLAFTIC